MYRIGFLLISLPFICGLEWSYQSLLQPGPCPNSITLSSLDIHQLEGEWNIEQLSPLLPVCCRRPRFELMASQAASEMNSIPHWMEATFEWSQCSREFTCQRMHSFNVRLWPNSISAGSFLLQLPSPLNLVGFSTLNFVSTDYKNHAAGYICHSLLLEHVLIPMIMVRPAVDLDPTETQRLKWILAKQGIHSALGLTNVLNAECNDLPSVSETSIFYENSTAENMFISQSTSADSFRFETSTIRDIMPAPKPSPRPAQTPLNPEAIDPDSEVEWITPTTANKDDAGGIQFPEPIALPSSDPIWPFLFLTNPVGNSKLPSDKLLTS